MHTERGHGELISLLKLRDEKSFEVIYDQFADRLYRYVYSRLRVKEESEEIVQEVFVSLWMNRASLEITSSLNSYLFAAAKRQLLWYLRDEGVRKKYAADFTRFATERLDNSNEEQLALKELERTIESLISELPEKCQVAFRMSRMEHEPINRIAERMNISHRTVENYISQAMKHLRSSLGEFLTVIIVFFI